MKYINDILFVKCVKKIHLYIVTPLQRRPIEKAPQQTEERILMEKPENPMV